MILRYLRYIYIFFFLLFLHFLSSIRPNFSSCHCLRLRGISTNDRTHVCASILYSSIGGQLFLSSSEIPKSESLLSLARSGTGHAVNSRVSTDRHSYFARLRATRGKWQARSPRFGKAAERRRENREAEFQMGAE